MLACVESGSSTLLVHQLAGVDRLGNIEGIAPFSPSVPRRQPVGVAPFSFDRIGGGQSGLRRGSVWT